ncbi:aromatic ring-hydroxylating dioxygenase subunit alpha [Leisingera sp. M527]|uniref:aromatic ring-hydroxylating oxygenase subunit alpha n=1 Tax=Leisingera sp. M527 TaxID=2867014 RepID=UPI0021A8DAA4|nr:aromatic ring-hydroxylating dioxygenase subunit alpha [Leisingera sp. M527]UWQ32341.1 aromatic ring-hydroxylating dioxygenase subunit alpha [Leisingera sp. M527]
MKDDALIQSDPRAGRTGLPAWSYTNPELLEEEKELLFRRHWQLVCHVNDVPEPGDFMAADFTGERALVVRGKDGAVRAFHNLCRHRGSRVVAEDKGHCKNAIICPFHGWAFNLDGTLRGAARPETLPDLDPQEWGLKPVEMDIWHGFVFVRFKPGPQPAVSEVMAQFEAELAPYGLADLLPDGNGISATEIAANWKCVRDVDNEGYHVPLAHPGLHDLFGSNYDDQPFSNGAARSFGAFRPGNGRLWSVRNYKKLLPKADGLDEEHQAAWLYLGVFPNLVFGIYPDSVIFYHEFPVENGRTIQRAACYKRPSEDRQLRAARYLSGRIDRITSKEDEQLIEWCWEAAFSSGYDGVILSDLEHGVRSYHDELRKLFPVLQHDEPGPGQLKACNAELLAQLDKA